MRIPGSRSHCGRPAGRSAFCILHSALCILLSLLPASADALRLEKWDGLKPDPALAREGRPSLAWSDIEKTTTAAAQDAPADWSRYRTLRFAAHLETPTDSVLTLVINSENPESDGPDYYSFAFPTNFQGWRDFVLPLDTLSAARKPLGWNQVGKVFFSSNWAHKLDPQTVVHLAGITLDTDLPPGMDRPAGELLTNRGFEMDGNADGMPDGWGGGRWEGEAKISLDTAAAHTGRCSARIDGDAKGRTGLSVGFEGEAADAAAVYLLSAWVKCTGASEHPLRTSARITSVGAGDAVLKSDYRVCDSGPFDWRRYEWLVIIPEGTQRFNLVLFHHGAGTAWWDDVSLRKARRVKALAPAQYALVADGRPAFRWEAAPGEASLVVTPAGDPARARRYPAAAGTFTLPEALPLGREYQWRVETAGADGGLSIALAADGNEPARFYAGTWEARMEPLKKQIAGYRALLEPLRALAERNKMWDAFSLLAKAVEQGERLCAAPPADPAQARAELDAILAELEYTAPWWQRLFLGDKGLFADLDLSRPGREKVRAAAAAEDWPAARAALLAYYRARKGLSYYAKHERPPARTPAVTSHAGAEALCTHKMEIHSYKEPTFDLGPDFNWHVFPNIDVEWPTKIHRHFHWSTLAAAYRQTGSEKYSGEIVQQLLDWAKDNPMERWNPERRRWSWSTLNATVRIYSSWIDSWLQIRDSAAWNADAQFVFLSSLREHGRFLMANHANQGNWVVAEARGLVELGIMFPEFQEAQAWRDEGFRRLRGELAVQVLSDGVHVERTPGYHGMTLDCFMQPVRLALLNKVDVAGRDEFVRKLEQMHEFYLYGSKPNRKMEQIGDSNMMSVDGRLREGWNLFRREDMQWVLTGGKEGRPPVHRSYAFNGAGQYVSRSAWNDANALWSILDWGGFLGHCHDDMGHLSLYAHGTEMLVDTGIYAYAGSVNRPFHGTVGHNTVLVDQKSQKHRDPLTARWASTGQFDVFHGTTDNSEPLIHERTMAFRQPGDAGPGCWLVVDRLTGEGTHRLDQRWHATERLAGRADGAAVTLSGKPGIEAQPSLVIAGLARPGLQTAVVEGAVSYSWYKKIPVDVTQFTLETALPAGFATVLYPTPPGTPPAQVSLALVPVEMVGPSAADAAAGAQAAQHSNTPTLQHSNQPTALLATITDRGRTFRDLWLVNHAGKGILRVDGLETDARVLCVRTEGERLSWFLSEGSLLRRGGETLFQAGEKVDGAGAAPRGEALDLVCTAGRDVTFLAPGPAGAPGGATGAGAVTLNGAPFTGKRAGAQVQVGTVDAPAVPEPPHAPGGPRFEIEPPPPPLQASAVLQMLPADAALPAGAARVEAEAFAGQGGGQVEVTATKVGASEKSFLHWDSAGHWLEWKVPVAKAGRYRVLVRACTSEARVLRKLSVNGRTPAGCEALELAGTGGFSGNRDDWRIFLLDAPLGLPAGDALLRLENVDGASMNLDWVALAPAGG